MNLIDRYVAEVGRHLPEKSRADIEKEIRSTLEDMLEDRSQKADRAVDDEMVAEVLKEFGHPRKVAASYLPERYLIGPQLYPYFMMVLKVALLVAFVVALIRISIGIFESGPALNTIIQSVVENILSSAGVGITVLGNVVLVFAIMQWAMPNIKEIALEWDPRSLPDETSKVEPLRTRNVIFEIVFSLAGVLIFNFYPQILSIGIGTQGKWIFIPFLSANFFAYLPWINLIWALELTMNAMLLRQGRWQPTTRWFSILIDIVRIGLIYTMIKGPSIIGLTAANLQQLMNSSELPATGLVNLISACATLGLTVAVIIQTIQVIVAIYRLLTKDKKINLLALA